MNLTQLAFDAIVESGIEPMADATDENPVQTEEVNNEGGNGETVEETQSPITKTVGEDGKTTLSVQFTLDPEVVAQKAKAMPKGVKREDQSDLELADDMAEDENEETRRGPYDEDEDDEEDDEDEDPYNGVNTEDEGTRISVFAEALDAIDGEAEDARQNSRHAQTPLENCRAKDPRFCPYHGDKAWKKNLEDEILAAGLTGATVEVTNNNGTYEVSIGGVESSQSGAAQQILTDLANTKGVKAVGGQGVQTHAASGTSIHSQSFRPDNDSFDSTGRLNEWIDDYIADVGGDPNSEFDVNDFGDLLEAQGKVNDFDAKMNRQDPNDVKKYNDLLKDAENKYHSLIAQQYFKDVKTDKDATDKIDEFVKDFTDNYEAMHDLKGVVDDAKVAMFGKSGQHPRGFSASHPWADKYSKMTSNMFHRTTSAFYYAIAEFTAAQQAKDLKAQRTALASMDYQKDNFTYAIPAFMEAQKEYLQSMYDWASKDPKYSGKVATAFPNGRPQ